MDYKSPTQPLCRACGKPIPKHTNKVSFGETYSKRFQNTRPVSIEEARKLVNTQIVARRWTTPTRLEQGEYVPTGEPRFISEISTWDRESYIDEFFCKGACAQSYAYMCVSSPNNKAKSAAYSNALDRQAKRKAKA